MAKYPVNRSETRRERYLKKMVEANQSNFAPVCINFAFEENIAFVIRSAACFGAKEVIVIGALPSNADLKRLSGGTNEYCNIISFENTSLFLDYVRTRNASIVSAELCDEATNVYDFKFNTSPNHMTYLVSGHEQIGVPTEILKHSSPVFIPMPGAGFCLNTSQTSSIMMFEYMRQKNAQ